MGTRGLIGFIIRGVRKGAYNHFDSEKDIATMQAKVEALEWVDDVSEGGTNHNRDLLQRVWGGQIQVVDETDFIDDHLFCEWASFVDFGHRRVHVTAGWHDRKSAMWTFDGLRLDCFNDIDKVGVKEKQQLRIDDGTNGTHSSNGIVKVGVKEKEQLRIGDGTSDTQ